MWSSTAGRPGQIRIRATARRCRPGESASLIVVAGHARRARSSSRSPSRSVSQRSPGFPRDRARRSLCPRSARLRSAWGPSSTPQVSSSSVLSPTIPTSSTPKASVPSPTQTVSSATGAVVGSLKTAGGVSSSVTSRALGASSSPTSRVLSTATSAPSSAGSVGASVRSVGTPATPAGSGLRSASTGASIPTALHRSASARHAARSGATARRAARQRELHLRRLVQEYRGCLSLLSPAGRRLLLLRSGAAGPHPYSARQAARHLKLSVGQERWLETHAVSALESAGATGACASSGQAVALASASQPHLSLREPCAGRIRNELGSVEDRWVGWIGKRHAPSRDRRGRVGEPARRPAGARQRRDQRSVDQKPGKLAACHLFGDLRGPGAPVPDRAVGPSAASGRSERDAGDSERDADRRERDAGDSERNGGGGCGARR